MDPLIKKRILKLLSLLDNYQQQKEILEIDADSKEDIAKFLKNDSSLFINYDYKNDLHSIRNESGKVSLWYKDINGNWKINLYRINQLFILFFLFLMFSGCKKNNSILLENVKVTIASTEQINKLPLTDYYVKNYYYYLLTKAPSDNQIIIDESSLYEPVLESKKIIIEDKNGYRTQIDESEFKTLDQQRLEKKRMKETLTNLMANYEKYGRNKIEQEKDSIKKVFANNPKTGLIGTVTLKNNTGQNIEYAKITSVITYSFPNQKFYYSFPLKILKNDEIWKINEIKSIEIPNIFSYALEFNKFKKILNKHKAEEVELEYFIAYSNTIGLKNFNKEYVYEELDLPNRSIALLYGAFHKFSLAEKSKTLFGEKIYDNNITELIQNK